MTRKDLMSGIIVMVALAILIGLGAWQLQRLSWKQDLLTEIDRNTSQPPVWITQLKNEMETPRMLNYRRAIIRGELLHDHEVFIGPRVNDAGQNGFHVVTPLRMAGYRDIIFVNLGWVPEKSWERERYTVMLTGLLHAPKPKARHAPENNPEKGEWYWLDYEALKAHSGLPNVMPVVFYACPEDIREGALPKPCQLRTNYPNNHLGYALFWLAMAGVLIIGSIAVYRKPH